MFHHGEASPQQQFLTALKQGNSVQATRVWLNMTPDDRANLSHGVGIKPQISPAEVQAQMFKHARQQTPDSESGEQPSPEGQVEEGDISSQMVEMPGVDADPAAGLESLPSLPGASGQLPTTAPIIQQIE